MVSDQDNIHGGGVECDNVWEVIIEFHASHHDHQLDTGRIVERNMNF